MTMLPVPLAVIFPFKLSMAALLESVNVPPLVASNNPVLVCDDPEPPMVRVLPIEFALTVPVLLKDKLGKSAPVSDPMSPDP